MDLKQSFTNIRAWVKEHPYAAVAILGGVIFLGWYASKHARAGDGPLSISAPSEAESPATLDSLGGGLGGGGFADILSDLNTSASPIPTPSPVTSIPTMTGAGMGSSLSPIPSLSQTFGLPASVSNPVLVSGAGSAQGIATAPAGLSGPQILNGITTYTMPGGRAASAQILGLEDKAGQKHKAPGKGIKERVQKNNPLAKAGKGSGKTPAQLVGKGRFFTGVYQGIYYINGYPITSGPLPGTSTLPGGRAASNQILGLGGSDKER